MWSLVGLIAALAAVALVAYSVFDEPDEVVEQADPTITDPQTPAPTPAPSSATTAAVTSPATSVIGASPEGTASTVVGDPAGYAVRVVNAGGPGGSAGRMVDLLRFAGWQPDPPADAAAPSLDSVVLVANGEEPAGRTVAMLAGLPSVPVLAGDGDARWLENGRSGLDVLVVVGADQRLRAG